MTNSPPNSQPPITTAEVRAHAQVTRYTRRGSGPLVVVVQREAETDASWLALVDALALGYRVLVPELPLDHPDPAGCLTAFLEGLGAFGVIIMATHARWAAALAFAQQAPDQIACLVLVHCTGEHDDVPDCTGLHRQASVPLLVIRDVECPEAVLTPLTRFRSNAGAG